MQQIIKMFIQINYTPILQPSVDHWDMYGKGQHDTKLGMFESPLGTRSNLQNATHGVQMRHKINSVGNTNGTHLSLLLQLQLMNLINAKYKPL